MLVVVRQVTGLRRLFLVEALAAQSRDELPHPRALAFESFAGRDLVDVITHARKGTHRSRLRHSCQCEASRFQTEPCAEVDEPFGEKLLEEAEAAACVGRGQQA